MKSFSVRSFDTLILGALLVLAMIVALSLSLVPRLALAAAVSVTSVTATSSNVYTNTGFATTSRMTSGDSLRVQLNLGGTPLVDPQINIFNLGSTTMTGAAGSWYYSTSSVATQALWTEGAIAFYITVGSTDGGAGTTTVSQSSVTNNVTYDVTAPTLSSVAWTDTDSSKQFSATDTFLFTFSEAMATTTLSNANLNTVLGVTNSHIFSTTTAPTWNVVGTQLTVTLGAGTTVTGADTVQPTTTVRDAAGNTASGAQTAIALGDTTAPGDPTGLSDTTINKTTSVSLASVGSSAIRYTTDGTTPSCTDGTVYSSAVTIAGTATLKAIGCDEANNASSVVTAVYTFSRTGTGSVSGGGSNSIPAVPATHIEGCVSGNVFNTVTGKSCTIPATPAVPATNEGCALGNRFSTANGRPCAGGASAGSSNYGQGVSAAVHAFMSDLKTGSLGSDVKALQEFLNARGFTVAASGPGSPGNETTTFGALTRAAVIKYQKSKGITPAVGYFGPITRKAVEADQ